jgi:GTP cyclohydrolase I
MYLTLNHVQIDQLAQQLAGRIIDHTDGRTHLAVYPVPRGGVPVAYALCRHMPQIVITGDPADADIIVDDLIDSGSTRDRFEVKYPGRPFFALLSKEDVQFRDKWIVFPWETKDDNQPAEDNIVRLLQAVGENPGRQGLSETPHRVIKAWKFWTSGYNVDPTDVLKVFEDGAEGYDQMVSVCDIPIYSHCEHHLASIFGTATIAYIPDGKIVGLSKLSRLADVFARRLQVQERLTNDIANALMQHLQPKGCGVVIRARHMCMESRGVCQQGHHTRTTALRGVIMDDAAARSEFLALAK